MGIQVSGLSKEDQELLDETIHNLSYIWIRRAFNNGGEDYRLKGTPYTVMQDVNGRWQVYRDDNLSVPTLSRSVGEPWTNMNMAMTHAQSLALVDKMNAVLLEARFKAGAIENAQ